MSGWDEGAVYYSNQAQFMEASGEAEAAAASSTTSRHSVLKFKEFISNFKKKKNVFPYRESLVNNPKFLLVHLEDLLSFDSDLPSLIRSAPPDYLPLFEKAAAEVLGGLKMKLAGDSGEMVEPQTGEVQILLTSKEDTVSLRSLEAQYISKLVKISGITIAASRIKAKATYVHLICKNCKNTRAIPCRPGLGGAIVPRSCDHIPQPGEEACPTDPWLIGAKLIGICIHVKFEGCTHCHKGAVAVRQPYIRVVGMEETSEASSRGPATFTQEEIAPSIFGHDDVKKADACLLFGGARKFLKFVEKTSPIAVYTSGKGSSAAGLTASVIRDSSSREFYLEGGAMVLADGGVVCIEEFDKMRPEDRVAIHEAMEQQTISIAKAGITTVLNSRTSVLASANPPSGRYDDLKTAQDNIDLQTTILSRFDLIFIVKDIRMYDQDKVIASHVIKVHASAQTASNDSRTPKEDNWLKRYIQYCRTECHPRLSEAACAKLQSDYVDIRRGMRQQANETGESAAIPITVRQLEAIIRLSEALAKMKLSHVATEGDVAEALSLFKVSTMDAARSGINQHINISPDMANEIKQAENQIKRRLGNGNRISERRLIDDLTRMGMNESIVRRAILIMHQRGDVEYQRERHIIVRKA
ncbi:DNA replication licensing factor MCM5 [Hibiscus syriacus]|uniref:DNA replication licensing factor MCM5 n=1 Tax=Hibiscus syriacus TaxID=106335 RepID=A0A6A3B1B8_HIBSY|nr:DNA replication licensing factor MCM5 [Hibiscus syriacus]